MDSRRVARPSLRILAAAPLAAALLAPSSRAAITFDAELVIAASSFTDDQTSSDNVGADDADFPFDDAVIAKSPGGGRSETRARVGIVESPDLVTVNASGSTDVTHPLASSEDQAAGGRGQGEFSARVCVGEPAMYSAVAQATVEATSLVSVSSCCDAIGNRFELGSTTPATPTLNLPLGGSIDAGGCLDLQISFVSDVSNLEPARSRTSWSLELTVMPETETEGDVFVWVGGPIGSFGDPGSWDPVGPATEGVPTFVEGERADAVIVNQAGPVTIDLGGAAAAALSRGRVARGAGQRRIGREAVGRASPLRHPGGTLILDNLGLEIMGLAQQEGLQAGRSLEVGNGAEVLLDQDALQARHVAIGSGGDGRLVVQGPNGAFSTLGRFGLGADGDGSVEISNGATVTTAESVLGEVEGRGSAVVEGANTLWLTGNLAVGCNSPGGLEIKGGAQVRSENAFVDASSLVEPDPKGPPISNPCTGLSGEEKARVLVSGKAPSGEPSTWETTGIRLDVGPRGSLEIDGGGKVEASFLGINGDQSLVEVRDGRLEAGNLVVTDGDLRVSAKGRVATGLFILNGTTGQATFTGPSNEDQLAAADLVVASAAADLAKNGILRLENGARVKTDALAVGNEHPESFGQVQVSGVAASPGATRLRVEGGGDVQFGFSSPEPATELVQPTAQLEIVNGRVELEAVDFFVERRGLVTGSNGEIEVVAGTLFNAGVIACGVHVTGSYQQEPTGVLGCEAASLGSSSAPQLNPLAASRFARALGRKKPAPPPFPGPFVVDGDATLDGLLVLQFTNGFAPRTGDAFDLLQVSGTVSGSFADVVVRGLAPGFEFAEDVLGGRIVLTSLNDAVPLPTVSLKAKPRLKEKKKRGLKLKVSRKGDTSQPLSVRYTIRGSARNGIDYELLPGVVEIPARKRSAKLLLRPFADGLAEGAETIELEVLPGENYTQSLAARAEIELVDPEAKKPR
jgi:T5SS/PEP-CTERM-associated repeat protein